MDKKLHWHPAFCAAMELEFRDNRENLGFEREHSFNVEPLQADLLLIKKDPGTKLVNEIGRIFRTWNIIEYKSPDDSMNIDDLYKTYAYACLLKAQAKQVDEYPAEEITVTLLRQRHPRAFFKKIREGGYEVSRIGQGIYEVGGSVMFRTQVVVSGELEGGAHAWLMSLSRNLSDVMFRDFARSLTDLTDRREKDCADTVLELVFRANAGKVEQWREQHMGEMVLKFVEPLIKEKERVSRQEGRQEGRLSGLQEGRREGRLSGLKEGRQEGILLTKKVIRLEAQGCDPEEIARQTGITVEEVRSILA